MNILLIEPFYTGSHKAWCDGLKQLSSHNFELLTLSGHYWKWRMHGGAITLARKFLEADYQPDLILCSDMLDLTTFLSLTRKLTANIPTAVYFHENQLTYPWSPDDRDVKMNRNNHYAFINCVTALTADKVFFNSEYHLNSFLDEIPNLLKGFPDHNELNMIEKIKAKSHVLHLGMNLKKLDGFKTEQNNEVPIILWNHRWEYDKNPKDFFSALKAIKEKGLDFKMVVLGENFSQFPEEFENAKAVFKDNILQFGFVESFEEYATWLWKSDILPVTSIQDFFGGSVVQAMYCNVYPILPNRLSYKEHIPVEYRKDHFYTTQKELEKVLIELISAKNYNNVSTQSFIKKYDWLQCIDNYDKQMSYLFSKV